MPEMLEYCRGYNVSELGFFSGFLEVREALYAYGIGQAVIPLCDRLYRADMAGFEGVITESDSGNSIALLSNDYVSVNISYAGRAGESQKEKLIAFLGTLTYVQD